MLNSETTSFSSNNKFEPWDSSHDIADPIEVRAFDGLQRTIAKRIEFQGIGVHTAKPVSITVEPAEENQGIVFETATGKRIAARVENLVSGGHELCTVIQCGADKIMTIEHIMAAFASCGIDNALVRLNGTEIPILDGSAQPFVQEFLNIGVTVQTACRQFLKITQEWHFKGEEGQWISFRPLEHNEISRISVKIDFKKKIPAIGLQNHTQTLAPGKIRDEIMPCRTFGLEQDRLAVQKKGLALGSSRENSLLYDEAQLLTSGGLRFDNECVRHKMLDLIGDLYLSGWPLLGHIDACRPSHSLNGLALQNLLKAGAAEFTSL